MEVPSLAFVESLQRTLNDSERFAVVSEWSDVKVLLCLGEERYWRKASFEGTVYFELTLMRLRLNVLKYFY